MPALTGTADLGGHQHTAGNGHEKLCLQMLIYNGACGRQRTEAVDMSGDMPPPAGRE
jgi:hypothetical protein